ncbi:MAG TPA: flagellin [Sulfurimonas sp.]|nr:flagellin [Sulfurimonas sp.]
MGFRINTNVAALNAHNAATLNNRNLDSSLAKLSSGLRINTAADDASGMAIADSLRSQANSLGQAVANANDAIGLIQTADKAMDEQIKILDTIKTKAIQAASDGQTTSSREAIQKDVNRLLEQLDNIAKTTSFNGQVLLSGKFSNKEFQVGAYSNQTIKTSISNTQSIATGNMATRNDIVALGNVTSMTSAAQGATVISVASGNGLAVGDVIRIEGAGDYTITGMDSVLDASTITIDRALEKTLTGTGINISVVSNMAEDLSNATADNSTVLSMGSVAGTNGFAVGDKIIVTLTSGDVTRTVTAVSGALVTLDDVASTGATLAMGDRQTVGTAFATSDYVKYTVEGMDLTGVQLTNSSAEGVVNTGLGRVADLINESTSVTGIKAVANVEANSLISVAGGALGSDMKINGVTVMEAGQTILAGDSDSAIVSAINEKSALTGVRADLEADGTLTLTSDGRAMKLEGFTDATGINDGTVTGSLDLTKNGLEVMKVISSHFSDAGLTTVAAAGVGALSEIVDNHTLSELVTGQRDSNGDGKIDNDDEVGLLMTREGAMLAMDITEAAIGQLDAIRADLGSTQNQLTVTVNNISVTQVNVKAAESNIRDVDFAAESAAFSKYNILAQSGSYAMSQANAVQQNVLRLLQ